MPLTDPPTPGQNLKVRVYCTYQDQVGINVLHYNISSVTGGGLTLQQIADEFSDSVAPLYAPLLSAAATFYGVDVVNYALAGSSIPYNSREGTVAGNAAGNTLPRQVSGIITKKTLAAGPAFRGRIYVPFPGEDSNATDTTPTADYVADLQNLADTLLDTIVLTDSGVSTTLRPALWHSTGALVGTVTLITEGVARDKWANQRRRGAYGKPNAPPF